MGLPEVDFLLRNCILVELKLFYQTVFPVKELYWNHRITTELSRFSDIKYARSTFALSNGTFQKTRPKLDLILASHDIHKLATILFNLKAFIMNGKDEKSTDSNAPANRGEEHILEQKYSRLLNIWERDIGEQGSPFLQLQPDSNLLFAKRPVKYATTTENEDIDISSKEFFKLQEKQHRTDDVYINEYIQPPSKIRDGEHGSNFIHFKPSLYYSYSSLPANMKLWLDGLEDDKMSLMGINEKSTENLDILLHGFRGFPKKYDKTGN
ncbi:hypothetical protein SKDZ_16G3890 [Saccharomyces kudriavzevii ZP591]|uniref:Mss18p n=1 Tax=Saccharomyces cerevisiae x Saccharomyces kudriavzevii (strain VIN7) TaxID=1095631 RepID=H0H2J0_SACCK|nr:Mss18p [Saccharomyces cerevisiae x Saccharomyces kudriavzevii VIN7]CAI4054052.1 hypothetical protein SKDZ_16G3890 [Saccharomyces kudriavzevii ZP591]